MRSCQWQARRDSNPQPPDLESGALPVRATGLSDSLFRLFVRGMRPAKGTIFFKLQLTRCILFVFRRRIVATLAGTTCKGNDISHFFYFLLQKQLPHSWSKRGNEACVFSWPQAIISLITPAPTVRPPSRIAKRRPTSIAIGVISSASTDTLSPGITISTPSASVTTPVTSVVRK